MKVKKLLFAVSIVLMSVFTQAASTTWNIILVKASSDFTATAMTAYLVNASTVSMDDMKSALATDGISKLADNAIKTTTMAYSTANSTGSLMNQTLKDLSFTGGPHNFYTVVIADTATDGQYFLLSQNIAASVNPDTGAFSPSLQFGSQAQNTTWTAVGVPEPTSSLLLLVGGALLALRRKQE